MQGLEFRNDSENSENNDPRGLILSHEREDSDGKNNKNFLENFEKILKISKL